VAGTVLVYALLFGLGHLLLHSLVRSLPYLATAMVSGWWLARELSRQEAAARDR
jgi:hypothetical protein